MGGDNEVQRTMLELINQLDGFDPRGNIKVLMATSTFLFNLFSITVNTFMKQREYVLQKTIQSFSGPYTLFLVNPSQSLFVYFADRPDTLDPALMRPGRLDRKIEFALPDLAGQIPYSIFVNLFLQYAISKYQMCSWFINWYSGDWVFKVKLLNYPLLNNEWWYFAGRAHILKIHAKQMSVERDIRYDLLARLCPNSTGAEIRSVCTEAGMFAIRARRKVATEKDFLEAINKVYTLDSIYFFIRKMKEFKSLFRKKTG